MTAAKVLLNHWICKSHVGVIELASPSNRNALSKAMLQQLRKTIHQLESDPSVRVIVLQAQGPVFSSGHDLKQLQSYQQEQNQTSVRELFDLCSDTMVSIATSPKPFVAKVDGVATAAGCQLVASCDLAYASSRSKFATPGVNVGLFCSTPAVALGRCVPFRKRIVEMLLTGNFVSSQEAESMGLINRAVHQDMLDQTVDEVVDTVVVKSQSAIRIGKPTFAQQMMEPCLETAYAVASKSMCDSMLTDECIEGVDSFLNKRTPKW